MKNSDLYQLATFLFVFGCVVFLLVREILDVYGTVITSQICS